MGFTAVYRFPGLKIVMDYLQSVLQVQVTEATGQNFGTFATVNGVPLAFNLITAVDLSKGARRGFGQSCLTESNTVYQVWHAVPMQTLAAHALPSRGPVKF